MEKYARQHLAEGIQHADELHVDMDSEIFRALNSHYNRNNQLEVSNGWTQWLSVEGPKGSMSPQIISKIILRLSH